MAEHGPAGVSDALAEYPEWEGTHEEHRVQLLAPHRTTQKPNPMSESGVQTLFSLQDRLGAVPTALGACPGAWPPSG